MPSGGVLPPALQKGHAAVSKLGSATPASVEGLANRPRWRVFLLAAATSAALWSVTALLLSAPWLDARQKQLLTDSMLVLFPMPGVVYAWATTRATTGRLRRTWLCLTATLGSWTLGNLVWFYNQVLVDQPAFPTIGDACYVAALGFAKIPLYVMLVGVIGTSGMWFIQQGDLALAMILFLLSLIGSTASTRPSQTTAPCPTSNSPTARATCSARSTSAIC